MSYSQPLAERRIAISISESPDMQSLGLSDGHLHDAMGGIAQYLLALGADLVYGGDLRAGGFSEWLFELASRHRRTTDDDTGIRAANYLAWPVHIGKPIQELKKLSDGLAGVCSLIYLAQNGRQLDWKERAALPTQTSSEEEWPPALTAMRLTVRESTNARIVLGGRVEDFKGIMPGIAEEALLSLRVRQPLFVLGGFGGCASDICESLQLGAPRAFARNWSGRDAFAAFHARDLNNGLSDDDNRTLALTPHIDQAITLIMRGLLNLFAKPLAKTQSAATMERKGTVAAHELWVELFTRITAQNLHFRSGQEEAAVKSIVGLFETTRKLMRASPGADEFLTLASGMLETIRPYTARWHGLLDPNNQFLGPVQRTQFRMELSVLQNHLRKFADALKSLSEGDPGLLPPGLPPKPLTPDLGANVAMGLAYGDAAGSNQGPYARMDQLERLHVVGRRTRSLPIDDKVLNGTGLALSGGGIRSATFCLGVARVLAARGFLTEFDYLSTVSGGGYLGAFLSSQMAPEGSQQDPDPNGAAIFKQTFGEKAVDSQEVRYLRNNSKYLLPATVFDRLKLIGLLISGFLTTGLLGLAVPVFAAFTVHLLASVGLLEMPSRTGEYSVSRPLLSAAVIPAVLAAVCWLLRPVTPIWRRARKLLDNTAAGALIVVLAALAILATPPMQKLLDGMSNWKISSITLSGLVSILTGAAVAKAVSVAWRFRKALSRLFILSGIVLFTIVYLAMTDLLTRGIPNSDPHLPAFMSAAGVEHWVGIALLIWLVWAASINLNLTGLHRYYRDALSQCYLRNRDPAPALTELSGRLPYHLINTTVNLTSRRVAELRGRGGDFFLLSKYFCGSPILGYQPTQDVVRMNSDLDLATAMAISGAAASTNMGWQTYHQYRVLMAIFNVRLGYWLRWRTGGWGWLASNAFVQFTRELLGLLGERSSTINLSDGGHIENLAVYELIRRRLKFIVCVDGGMDAEMVCADLSRLQRLVAIDFGYHIDFDPSDLKTRNSFSSNYGMLVKVDYTPQIKAGGPKQLGWLLYIKLSMLGTEPNYLLDYRRENPLFPHQSTIDQFFDEAQFEAYRQLGESAARHFLALNPADAKPGDFATWFQSLAETLLRDTDPVYVPATTNEDASAR
jgi:hypothetical protein